MFVWAYFPQSNFPNTFYLPGARIKLFLASIFSFYWLHVSWKITLSKRSFHVRKAVRENLLFIFFSLRAKYVFILLLIRAFKKFYLYMHFYVLVSVCMLVHVKIFLSIALLKRATHDSCLCCSAVWKMSSQIHTGIEKVDNEASTILERKKCVWVARGNFSLLLLLLLLSSLLLLFNGGAGRGRW